MFTIHQLMRLIMIIVTTIIISVLSHNAEAKTPVSSIPVIGKTTDGKYPIYKLQGELADVNYSSGNTVYSSGDLLGKLVFIKQSDVNNGYLCDFVCKDKAGNIVGINPVYKSFKY